MTCDTCHEYAELFYEYGFNLYEREPEEYIRDWKDMHMFCVLDEIDVVTGEPVA